MYLCVLCGSENKQQLFPYTALTDCFYNLFLLRGTDCVQMRFILVLKPYSTDAPHSSSCTCCCYQTDKRAKFRNLSIRNDLPAVGKLFIKQNFHFLVFQMLRFQINPIPCTFLLFSHLAFILLDVVKISEYVDKL